MNKFIAEYLELFKKKIELKARSKGTYNLYKGALNRLGQNFETIEAYIDEVNKLLQYLEEERQNSINSLAEYRVIFKGFYKWLQQKLNNFAIDYDASIKYYKGSTRTRQPFNDEQIEVLFYELKRYRYKPFSFIFKFFFVNGIRIKEWNNVNFELLLERGSLNIRTAKKNNNRTVVLPDDEKAQVINKNLVGMRDELLYNLAKIKKINTKTIENHFSKFSEQVKKYNPDLFANTMISSHICRHTLATILYNQGATVAHIANVLGHVNSSTVQKTYIDANQLINTALLLKKRNNDDDNKDNQINELIKQNELLKAKLLSLEMEQKSNSETKNNIPNNKPYAKYANMFAYVKKLNK